MCKLARGEDNQYCVIDELTFSKPGRMAFTEFGYNFLPE